MRHYRTGVSKGTVVVEFGESQPCIPKLGKCERIKPVKSSKKIVFKIKHTSLEMYQSEL